MTARKREQWELMMLLGEPTMSINMGLSFVQQKMFVLWEYWIIEVLFGVRRYIHRRLC